MKLKDIIDVSFEIEFGGSPKESLKAFINKALDEGEHFEGFEIAIQRGELDYQAYDELFASFQAAYSDFLPDLDSIKNIIDSYLPQSYFSNIVWIVSSEGEIVLSDGLRVAKIADNKLSWVTKRVSWDDIKLLSIENGIIVGEWYSPINDEKPWGSLKITLSNGTLIEGEVIEY
jgi:hypothetical protein